MISNIPAFLSRLACILGLAGAAAPSLGAQTIAEVQVTPDTMTLAVGQREALFATAYDRAGNIVPSARFAFWISDSTIARVAADGTVTGVRPGRARVEVRTGGRRGTLAIVVRGTGGDTGTTTGGPPPAGQATVLAIEPTAVQLMPSETVELVPRALREDGTPVDAGRVVWKSLRPEVATVDSAGIVVAVAPGQSIIQATSSRGLVAAVPVDVEAAEFALSDQALRLGPGDLDTLRAVVPVQGNREVKTVLQWQSTDTMVVRVGPTGIVRAVGPGSAEVVASGFFQERRVSVSVYPLPEALVVSPPAGDGPIVLGVGATRGFTAIAEAADSTPIPEVRITWTVDDSTIATFDQPTRTLTARATGSTTLTARLSGFPPVVWTIRVVPGAIALDRRRIGLAVGQRTELAVHFIAADGSPVAPASAVRWRTDRAEVARIGADGTIEGVGFGRAVITVTTATGSADSAVVFVGGDLLVSSDRQGTPGIYQLRVAAPDHFVPVLVDSASHIDAVYSPDRTRIAFSSDREGGDYDLWVMDADGRNLRRLTAEPGADVEPAWLPDGSGLVFAATRGNATQLYRIGSDGGGITALTAAPGASRSPAVAPDGRTVMFVSTRDGNAEIYQLDLSTGIETRLTRTPVRESSPQAVGAGEVVYVVEEPGRPGGSRIVRQAAGGTPVTVVVTREPVLDLAVSRDGTQLAYVAGRLADRGRRARLDLVLQPPGVPNGRPVRLLPDEQVVSPAF